MIEQIQGAGLSGMTGKSTKHGKNSLFAKLLAMLEKNAELSGKGKGLQLHTGKAGKEKGLAGLTEKSDPFTVAKNKHLVALAAKEKSERKDKTDDATTSLLVAQVLVDQKVAVQPLHKTGNTSVLIDGEKGFLTAKADGQEKTDQAGIQFGKSVGDVDSKVLGGLMSRNKADVAAAKDVATTTTQQKVTLNDVGLIAGGLSKGDAVAGGLSKGDAVAGGLSKGDAVAGGLSKGDAVAGGLSKGDAVAGGLSKGDAVAGGLSKGDSFASIVAGQKTALSTGQNTQSQSISQADSAAVNLQAMAGQAERSAAVNQSIQQEQQASVLAQGDHSLGEKKGNAGVDGSNVAALFQQAKASQAQQSQQSVTATVSAASLLANQGASLENSGSSFSDRKGGQDARTLDVALNDVRSTTSTSNSNFQSYLTSKSAPVLSPFDTMNYIAQSAKNGQTKIEIQLDPANLGKIHISLQSDAAKQLQVHMIVDQSMTRAALEQQLPQLRSALAQQGFDLSGFSMDSQGKQASSDGGGNHSGRRSHDFDEQIDIPMGDMAAMDTSQRNMGSGLSIRV